MVNRIGSKLIFLVFSSGFFLLFFFHIQARNLRGRLVIKNTVEESKDINPDVYVIPVKISIKGNTRKEVMNTLKKVEERLFRKNLRMDIVGHFIRKTRDGLWVGEGSYKFYVGKEENKKRVLNALSKIKRKFRGFHLTIHEPYWDVSKAKIKRVTYELQLRIIDASKKLAHGASQKTGMICSIREINLEPPEVISEKYKWEKRIRIKATVLINCYSASP